jgi:hypothetical protein
VSISRLSSADPGDLADRLGEIKAAIADLKASEASLKDLLKAHGPGSYEGADYRATYSVAEREVIDWRAVAERLNPSRQLIAAHSSRQEVERVDVRARKS